MAESKQNRTKAAKLRSKKTLTPEQRKWLTDYDARVARGKPASSPRTPPAPTPRVVRGPQLQLVAGTPPIRVAVQETSPPSSTVTPEAYVWTPTTPPAPDGVEPPPPGAPQPPTPGTPLVDALPEQAPPRPQGDPAAAEQFAALVVLIATLGIDSGRELVKDVALPETFRTIIDSDEAHARALLIVGTAARNVAIKYGFTSVPMADEAIVAVACAGSLAAFVAVQKKKLKTKARAKVAAPEPPKPPAASVPSEIERLFQESAS